MGEEDDEMELVLEREGVELGMELGTTGMGEGMSTNSNFSLVLSIHSISSSSYLQSLKK